MRISSYFLVAFLMVVMLLSSCKSNKEDIGAITVDFVTITDSTNPNHVKFTANIKGAYDIIRWNIGDQEIITGETSVSHVFIHKGTYKVTLSVWKGLEEIKCEKTIVIEKNILDFDFTLTPNASDDNIIDFKSTIAGAYDKIVWNFGNGEQAENIKDASATYPNAGTYTVKLSVWSHNVEFKTEKTVTISKDIIDVAIVSESVAASNGHKYKLKAVVDGPYSNLKWTIRGKEITGATETEAYFPFTGTYTVTLSAGSDKYTFKKEKTFTISGNDPDYVSNLKLVWADEFDGTTVNQNSWKFETGANGWGNNELQNYTNGENAAVSNGLLTITARKINNDHKIGSYTSTRMATIGKKDFLYGRMEIRAKLPSGKGTWPAIWMLGSNINSISWPACGEIDMMEHIGSNPNMVQSALHTPSSSGATINYKQYSLASAETEFHNYGMVWTEQYIQFYIDTPDNVFYTYNPTTKNSSTWPFNKPCFFILNIAIGGNMGGEVDDTIFPQNMVADYVRVYQE
jgi:beta-glucanase (GH16 family)